VNTSADRTWDPSAGDLPLSQALDREQLASNYQGILSVCK